MSTTVGANAATHTPHWASDCALPPRCLVAHLCGDGRLPPLRARPRRLERSRFVSRRSAHGSRPCLGGPIQPPPACYRHSHPQRGPNAARNMALYAGVRAVTSHRRLERSRVGLVLRAVRAHVAAVPGRPDDAADRAPSPCPARVRPVCKSGIPDLQIRIPDFRGEQTC